MPGDKIHINEKPALGRKLGAIVRKQYGSHTQLGGYADGWDEASNALESALEPKTSGTAGVSAATGVAVELDGVRDDESRGTYYILLAYSVQRHDPELAKLASEALALYFPSQLSLVSLPYAKQSTATNILLETAGKNENKAKLEKLIGAPAFFTGLAAAEANFEQAVNARPVIRAAVNDALAEIVAAEEKWNGVLAGYLGAVKQAFPSAKQTAVRDKLLEPIKDVKAKMKAGATARKNRKKTETPA